MQFFKKITSFSIIAAILVMLGIGCKGPDPAAELESKKVVLEYWTVYDDVDQLNKLIAEYTAERPYIQVNLKQIPPGEFYSRLVEALAEDRGPDIISVQNRALGSMISKLAPMPGAVDDTLVTQEGGLVGPGQKIQPLTRILPTPREIESEYIRAIYRDVVINGQVYGLPLSVDTMAIFYNKDLLDRSGVAQVPTNWNEFRTAVRKITKYDAKSAVIQSGTALGTGNNISGVDDLLYIFFAQSGTNFVTDSGRPLFQNAGSYEEAPGSANYLLNFYTGFANKTTEEYSWDEAKPPAIDAFTAGSVGFFFGYSYHLPVIKAKAPQLNFGIIPLFQLDPERPVDVVTYWVQAVTLKSKHQGEAWGLIDFLTHSSATKSYLDATGRPTALRAYIDEQKKKSELAPFVNNVLTAKSWYRGQNYDGALQAIQTMVHEWLQPVPENVRQGEWKQTILERAAAKIEQTF